ATRLEASPRSKRTGQRQPPCASSLISSRTLRWLCGVAWRYVRLLVNLPQPIPTFPNPSQTSRHFSLPFKRRPEARSAHRNFFRQHTHIADRGHEVGVARPSWDDMHVEMVGHAGAGGLADVDPYVEALRRIDVGQRAL